MATVREYATREGSSFKVEWDLPKRMVPFGQKRAKGVLTLHDEEQANRAAAIAQSMKHAVTAEQVSDVLREIFYKEENVGPTLSQYVSDVFWGLPKPAKWGDQTRRDNEFKVSQILERIGDRPLSLINGAELDALLGSIKTDRAIKRPTLDQYYQILSQVLKSAHDRGWMPSNPMVDCEYQKGERDDEDAEIDANADRYFDRDEYAEFLCYFRPDYRNLVIFLAGTGARFSEATAVMVKDIDFNNRKIAIRRAWKGYSKKGGKRTGLPKSKKPRTIEATDAVWEMLPGLTAGKAPEDYVFVGTRGGIIVNSNFRRDHWNPAMIKARQCKDHPPLREDGRNGLMVLDKARPSSCGCLGRRRWTELTPHSLRHSYATWAIFGGATLENLSYQLGHSSVKTTQDVYVHQFDRARSDRVSGPVDKYLIETDAAASGDVVSRKESYDRTTGAAVPTVGSRRADWTVRTITRRRRPS